LGGLQFKASPDKKEDPNSTKKLSMVVHLCDPSYAEGVNRRIKNTRPKPKK
jgi:hypothetical protein